MILTPAWVWRWPILMQRLSPRIYLQLGSSFRQQIETFGTPTIGTSQRHGSAEASFHPWWLYSLSWQLNQSSGGGCYCWPSLLPCFLMLGNTRVKLQQRLFRLLYLKWSILPCFNYSATQL